MKAATPPGRGKQYLLGISIHAAREGGDHDVFQPWAEFVISIHAAREGGDEVFRDIAELACSFQSTPPVKAATYYAYAYSNRNSEFQSTPPVKAATLQAAYNTQMPNNFNPRRP